MIAPAELRDRQQWLLWRFEPPKKSGGKPIKAPYYISGKIRHGTQGSDKDRQALTLYIAAVDALSRSRATPRPYDGIGFAFLPGDGLIGIDLDDALVVTTDGETGEVTRAPKKRTAEIITACNSYTEHSPSGKGVHIFVRGQIERSFKSNEIGVEVFCGAQYFTFTGEHYAGTPGAVNEISSTVIRRLQKTVAQARTGGKASSAAAGKRKAGVSALDNDFKRVNDAAIANLDAWVTALFPSAEKSSKGYRVHSADLGRELEEDLSITSEGIKDWGVHDMGDAREGGRTPIDLVLEWGNAKKPADALHWLAGQLGIALSRSPGRGPTPGKGAAGNRPRSPQNGGDGKAGHDDDPPEEPHGLPTIKWRQGFLRHCVDDGEKALLAIDGEDRLYQRAGMLVRVIRRDAANVRNFRRDPGMLGFQVVDHPYLVEALTAAARWEKWDGRSEVWRRINAPEQAAATYLSRVGRWRVPRLWSAISAPTLRPDGTVLQKRGYDEATATWYDPGNIRFPVVPEQPTKEDAERALAAIAEAFKTFPFVTRADRSVLLASVLTSLVRRSIPHAPLVAFTAPTSSSGKSLLADLVSIIATGLRAPAMKYPDTDEEAAKLALSVLMEGDPLILIDNVDRPLQGDWLCTILTSETYRARVLGRSEMISVPSLSMWMATGNNIVLAGDLRTRSLMCRIDPQMEHPEQRAFGEDIKETLARRRPELVAAGLTVMRAFITTGQRVADFVKPWGRFEQWTDFVRAPLVWLECADPCDSIASIEQDDPERGDLLSMLTAWRSAFGSEYATAREACRLASEIGFPTEAGKLLTEALRDVAKDRDGTFNAKRVAKWIGRHLGRRIDGMQFVKGREQDHVLTYRVEVLSKT